MNYAACIVTAVLDFLETYNGAVTAVATIFIAVFTIVLARVTGRQARLSREAINLARSEFIATHRPRIVLKEVSFVDSQIHYMLVNTGDTKATVIESWIFDELVFEQAIRPLRSSGHDDLERLTFEGGEVRDLIYRPVNAAYMMTPNLKGIGTDDRPPMIDARVYFTGAILYSDDAGICRRTVFRRQWVDDRKGFVRLVDPDQEYAD
jgi:hypothetical protein